MAEAKMRKIGHFKRTSSAQTERSSVASPDNSEPGYFMADYEYVNKRKILSGFLDRARTREDVARGINDQLLSELEAAIRAFLVQRKSNGSEAIHAEFVVGTVENIAVIGPVATARSHNHNRVREQRMLLLARVSLHPALQEGKCYALSAPNQWDDERVLKEFGYDAEARIELEAKAKITELSGGRDITIAVQNSAKSVPANIVTHDESKSRWRFRLRSGISLGPSVNIDIGAEKEPVESSEIKS